MGATVLVAVVEVDSVMLAAMVVFVTFVESTPVGSVVMGAMTLARRVPESAAVLSEVLMDISWLIWVSASRLSPPVWKVSMDVNKETIEGIIMYDLLWSEYAEWDARILSIICPTDNHIWRDIYSNENSVFFCSLLLRIDPVYPDNRRIQLKLEIGQSILP